MTRKTLNEVCAVNDARSFALFAGRTWKVYLAALEAKLTSNLVGGPQCS